MTIEIDRSAWSRVKLGDVAVQVKDKVDPSTGVVDRYVAGEHMDTDELRIHRWGQVGQNYLGPAFHMRFKPGQVLYGSRRTYLRKVALADFEGVCANTTFVIEPKSEQVLLREFLPLLMSTEAFHAYSKNESKGSVNPYVNWSDLAKYEFDLPTVEEQRRIADLLWGTETHLSALATAHRSVGELAQCQVDEGFRFHEQGVTRPLAELLTQCQYGLSTKSSLDGQYPILPRLPRLMGICG